MYFDGITLVDDARKNRNHVSEDLRVQWCRILLGQFEP